MIRKCVDIICGAGIAVVTFYLLFRLGIEVNNYYQKTFLLPEIKQQIRDICRDEIINTMEEI